MRRGRDTSAANRKTQWLSLYANKAREKEFLAEKFDPTSMSWSVSIRFLWWLTRQTAESYFRYFIDFRLAKNFFALSSPTYLHKICQTFA